MKTRTTTMETHQDYPVLSIFFGCISWVIAAIDATMLDQSVLQPLAHLAAIGSGAMAIVLGGISINEKFKITETIKKWRKRKK